MWRNKVEEQKFSFRLSLDMNSVKRLIGVYIKEENKFDTLLKDNIQDFIDWIYDVGYQIIFDSKGGLNEEKEE